MRLWSLHPENLDAKGLVALWREALLAQNVLAGKTKGYKNHPQLDRFKKTRDPISYIGCYLSGVAAEAIRRDYHFDGTKILKKPRKLLKLSVTRSQMKFETEHLIRKLKIRDRKKYQAIMLKESLRAHPIFRTVPGPIEAWERF